jgi:hypothetical protein
MPPPHPRNTTSRIDLVRTLSVYRRSREKLVAALVSEEPGLYHAMFEFKPNSAEMSLALEKYVFLWLVRHPAVYQELYPSQADSQSEADKQLFEQFVKHYHDYCKCFIHDGDLTTDRPSSGIDNPVMEVLLQHKIAFLGDLLKVSQNANQRMQRLRYQSTKAKALFERQFSELRRQQHGTGNT